MGVDVRVATWLREHGHDSVHLRDQGLQRLPNGEIFTKAISESRTILTFDLDFGEIAALARGRKASVIVFRLHNADSADGDRLFRVKPIACFPEGDHASERSDAFLSLLFSFSLHP